ncbi:MAG TPA: metallophosphoesterase, partial [Chitinophagaceae bacterium]|nr:metallophosphoesterase [Chitinophagaceae bacterium]
FPLLIAGYMFFPFIGKQAPVIHSSQEDGPYVSYKGNKVYVKYILDNHGTKAVKVDSFDYNEKPGIFLVSATDIPGKTFPIKLKNELEAEKTEYGNVSKLFVVSDIEGNFAAFRKLLQGNKVIDENLNWSFGNGHLVLTGDFFDRGVQVTEVLWLIYSLEDQAKSAGGHVHFILGNHEIMNMNNDLRYVHGKYFQHAALMSENYLELFSEKSELGRWLRTKNVSEKIGDFLFVHGGYSAEVNRLDLSLSRLNKLVRPYYGDTTYTYKDPKVDLLYSDLGPFWYRGYYTKRAVNGQAYIDSTLAKYKVKHIATGHTVISDTISVLYNGKLFNTDVPHTKGMPEALLVEGGKYYRVNPIGEKFQLLE